MPCTDGQTQQATGHPDTAPLRTQYNAKHPLWVALCPSDTRHNRAHPLQLCSGRLGNLHSYQGLLGHSHCRTAPHRMTTLVCTPCTHGRPEHLGNGRLGNPCITAHRMGGQFGTYQLHTACTQLHQSCPGSDQRHSCGTLRRHQRAHACPRGMHHTRLHWSLRILLLLRPT